MKCCCWGWSTYTGAWSGAVRLWTLNPTTELSSFVSTSSSRPATPSPLLRHRNNKGMHAPPLLCTHCPMRRSLSHQISVFLISLSLFSNMAPQLTRLQISFVGALAFHGPPCAPDRPTVESHNTGVPFLSSTRPTAANVFWIDVFVSVSCSQTWSRKPVYVFLKCKSFPLSRSDMFCECYLLSGALRLLLGFWSERNDLFLLECACLGF